MKIELIIQSLLRRLIVIAIGICVPGEGVVVVITSVVELIVVVDAKEDGVLIFVA